MVTILTPLFNGIEYFKECYDSVINQTDKEWKWIIGVNGHGDESNSIYTMLKNSIHDERIKVMNFDTKGKVNTLNAMIKFVTTEYICILDCDDVWLPEKLNFQKVVLKDNPLIDVLGTSCYYIGELNHILEVPEGIVSINTLFEVNPIVNSSVIMRTSLAVWEERFGLEDYDLWFRLCLEDKKMFIVNKPFILHRIHKESAFNSSGVQNVSELKDYYKKKLTDVTIVSAFFPMKSKYKTVEYLNWMAQFWSTIDCNLVFFTDEDITPWITNIRSKYAEKTKVITMKFDECNAYKKYGKQFWIDEEKKDFENCHSPDLYAIWYEKKEFVLKTIAENYFNTSKFVWMDAGICRSETWIPSLKQFYSHRIPDDSFLIMKITDFENEEDLTQKNSVGGGILCGTKEKWYQFSEMYDDTLQNFVKMNKFVGKDQTLIATMYKKNPSFFKLLTKPDYWDKDMAWFGLLFYLASAI